jgi:hypothetical protein
MLRNGLVCLDWLNFKLLSWKVCDSKLDNWTFKFIKISAQIINKISKVWQNKKVIWLALYVAKYTPFATHLVAKYMT